MFLHLDSLYKGDLVDFCLYLSLRYNYGYFNILLNLSYLNSSFIYNLRDFNLYYFILFDYLENLSYHFYFFGWQFNYLLNSYNFLHDLRLNDEHLLCMNNWNNFLYNLFHYFYSCLYMWNDLRNLFISNYLNNFFHNLWNNNYLLSFYNFLHYLLYNNLNRFNYLLFSLNVSHNFLDNLYRL